ncbi:T9SS type A sorting domain-containing protein [Flavobacterium chuncheonense]|uniref:T9SS type A sorting domain-containing protein n=1 Tax=Flavobacterium chuncheonense TaxID=2026653 RepID=A0ABW5YJ53_9FLAO
MKARLFFLIFIAIGQLYAQILDSENFDALTIGNVGTNIMGTVPGQGNWLTLSNNGGFGATSTNADNSNFQIVASGFNGTNGLQIIGPDGNYGERKMWKYGLQTVWASRTAGNNNIEVEFDFYTGNITTSDSSFDIYIYGQNGSYYYILAGFYYVINTRVLSGIAYLSPDNGFGGLENYLASLQSGGGDLILNANTWYRLGVGYNTTTGQAYWKINMSVETISKQTILTGIYNPIDVYIQLYGGNTNSTIATVGFDNYLVKATAADNLLAAETFSNELGSTLAIYPNPVKDVLNVKTDTENIKSVQIYDVKGRVVKDVIVNQNSSQLNVADLESGVYMIKIVTDQDSSTTKKFIKQ